MARKNNKENKNISIYESELYGDVEVKEEHRLLVVFQLVDEWYGVDIRGVREIIISPAIFHLPNVPDYIAGIFNFRGNIVSVTDLKKLFGLPEAESAGVRPRLVVIEHDRILTGILVDGFATVVEIPVSKIEGTVATLESEKGGLVDGQFEWDGRLIAFLNARKIIEKTRLSNN